MKHVRKFNFRVDFPSKNSFWYFAKFPSILYSEKSIGGTNNMNFQTDKQFILASQSPRRKELFSTLNVPFTIHTSDVEETSVHANSPKEYVKAVALLKTRNVATKYPEKVVIGADTIVVYRDQLLHKPQSEEQAKRHLQMLSDDVHSVMTAVAIISPNGEEHVFVEETKVYFRLIPEALMNAYIASGDPFDKAGGYGIQTDGALFVQKIEGDYNNVVGLPLSTLVATLLKLKYITIE